tara:strand:+ start:428 stop:799 length:372 start_codon:yes stop_codon:yes gene_type:complete
MSAAIMNEMERLRKAAEILVEKNDAANEKNRELMAELEKSRAELNAALERLQALAAQLDRPRVKILGELIKAGIEPGNIGDSLTKRDLIKQAEALEGMADENFISSDSLYERASELRKHADSL